MTQKIIVSYSLLLLSYKLNRILFPTTLLPSKCQRIPTASGVLHGSVLGHILFVIYANDLTNNLTIDHLLHADDVKLIAPENKRLPTKAP